MPIIKLAEAPVEEMTPENADELGPYRAHLLSDAGELTQFGACHLSWGWNTVWQ